MVRSLNHGVGIVVGHDCGMRLRALMTADAEVVLLRVQDEDGGGMKWLASDKALWAVATVQ